MMARGITRVGRRDSSPSEPADSKPAKARKPEVAARVRAERPTPGGSTNTVPDQRWPPGAVPAASRQQITPMSTRMRQTDTTSNASTDLVVGRTPRPASTRMTSQAARGQRIPVGVAGQPRGAQEGPPENGHAHDRHRREDQVRAEQRPARQEPGPRAEGAA